MPVEEPYRGCGAFKNLKDENGNFLKTVCAVYDAKSYSSAESFCVANQMKLSRIENPAVEKSLLDLTNDLYSWDITGYVHIFGDKGLGRCASITNVATNKLANFTVHHTGCGEGRYSYCDFKKPRGKFATKLKNTELGQNEASICMIML